MKTCEQTVAESLTGYLERSGVRCIFGFPGESTLPLYEAYKEQNKLVHIMPGCERCAGYMADVYARITNTIGIVDAPGGIGSPWLVPAISEARNSFTPLLAVVSGIPARETEKWTTSEFPQIDVFRPITNKALRLESPGRLFDFLRILLSSATGSRPGPVMLEIPSDILQASMPQSSDTSTHIKYPQQRSVPCDADLEIAAKIIRQAKRPIILAGGGIHTSQAYEALQTFSEKFGIPVATSINGKGAMDESHSLCLGVIGNKGTVLNNNFFRTRDLSIVVGSKLGDKTTDQYRLFPPQSLIVRIDVNSDERGRNFEEISLIGDARETIKRLMECDLPDFSDVASIKEMEALKLAIRERYAKVESMDGPVSPSQIIQEINKRFKGEAIIAADASVSSGWVGALGLSSGGRRNIITPRGSGSLGFGFPATLAAKIASPDTPVFGIGGDFGFAMSTHEIETACRLGLNIHYFILKNDSLGLLERHFEKAGKVGILDTRHPTDWQKIAEGFGAIGVTLSTNKDVKDYFSHLPEGPVIIQAVINKNIITPDFETLLNS